MILFSVTDSANIFWDSNYKIYLFGSIELITECVQSLITDFFFFLLNAFSLIELMLNVFSHDH